MERDQSAVNVCHPICRHAVTSEVSDRHGETWHFAFFVTDVENDWVIAYVGAAMGMN